MEEEVTKHERAWWLSWYHPPELGEFELHSPWWISGMRISDAADTIVAAVKAEDEEAAWKIVRQSYDTPPETLETRFIEELEDREQQPSARAPWSTPENGRFPKADWMIW